MIKIKMLVAVARYSELKRVDFQSAYYAAKKETRKM